MASSRKIGPYFMGEVSRTAPRATILQPFRRKTGYESFGLLGKTEINAMFQERISERSTHITR